jgi:hypothetical protein
MTSTGTASRIAASPSGVMRMPRGERERSPASTRSSVVLAHSWGRMGSGAEPVAYARRTVADAIVSGEAISMTRSVATARYPREEIQHGRKPDRHAPNDIVHSPFMGIGSEGYEALRMGRRFVGAELKQSYFEAAVKNLHSASTHAQTDLFAHQAPAKPDASIALGSD